MGGGVSNPLPEGLKVAIYGNDGTSYLILKVNAAGKLEVVVDTSALPTGAATAAHQVTMITALQLIDNLQAALDSVGTDELRVLAGLQGANWKALTVDAAGHVQTDVVSSALPSGAATAAHQVTLHGKFQNQAFTYKDQVYGKYQHTKSGAGSYTLKGAQVPDGEVWVICGIMGYNWSNAIVAMYLGLEKGGTGYWGAGTGAVVAKAAFSNSAPIILVKDDYPAVYFNTCQDGDSLTMMYNGYSMTKAT